MFVTYKNFWISQVFFRTNQWSDPHSANNVGSEKSATLLFLFALLRHYGLQVNQIYVDSYGAILLSSFFKPPEGIDCYPAPGPFQPCNDLFDWWSLRCGTYKQRRKKMSSLLSVCNELQDKTGYESLIWLCCSISLSLRCDSQMFHGPCDRVLKASYQLLKWVIIC